MPSNFAKYTEASVNALAFNPKSDDLIDRKQKIFDSVVSHHGTLPKSVLFFGFSPIMLSKISADIYICGITDPIKKFLDSKNVKYKELPEEEVNTTDKKFTWVIGTDEYLTFADSEDHQRTKVEQMCRIADKAVLTTLRDYKNLDFKDREFSLPLAVHAGRETKIFMEYHDYDFNDKNSFKTVIHEIDDDKLIKHGSFNRRNMYFKQLAKFSIDAGATNFYVHRNLMYKSLIKKNYEHVISISF
jgi:hypothetical protein